MELRFVGIVLECSARAGSGRLRMRRRGIVGKYWCPKLMTVLRPMSIDDEKGRKHSAYVVAGAGLLVSTLGCSAKDMSGRRALMEA